MSIKRRGTWVVWLLALSLVLSIGVIPVAAGSPSQHLSQPRSLVGQVVDLTDGRMLLKTPDGSIWNITLSPRLRVLAPKGGEAAELAVGQWARARVHPQPDGTLLTSQIRLLPPKGRPADRRIGVKGRVPERVRVAETVAAPTSLCGDAGGNQPTGDWPTLGWSPERSFYSPTEQRLYPPLSLEWQLYNENYWALQSPAIVNGIAYVGGYDAFYALDLEAQITLWTQTLPADNESSSPAVVDGVVYFGTWTGDVYALDASTGDILWVQNIAPEAGDPQIYSPAVVNGVVYVAVEAFRPDPGDPSIERFVLSVYALDTTSDPPGAEIWHTDIAVLDNWSSISDPVVVDGVVYVGTRDQGTFALDASTGAILWHAPHPDGAVRANVGYDGTIIVHNGVVIVPFTFGTYPDQWEVLYAYDAASGALLWTYQPMSQPDEPSYRINSSLLAYGDYIYLWLIAAGDTTQKAMVAINVTNGQEGGQEVARYKYTDNGDDGGWWWLSAANGVLYRTSSSLWITAFDLESGAWLDTFDTGSSIETAAALGAGRLVVPDVEGTLWVFGGTTGAHGICGTVFSDNNLNGVRDVGEPGIPNVTLTLTGTDTDGNPVSMSTTTDENGEYGFLNLAPGTYTVQETDPPGFRSVAAHPGSTGGVALDANTIADIPLPADISSVDNDFGDIQPVDILGTVFEDLNLNGQHDAGEPPLTGITVTLTGGAEPLVAVTDETGAFAFLEVFPGSYVLHEENPAGYFSTTPDDLPVMANYPGQVYADNDFGDARYASLSGAIYFDRNQNGVWDAGEPPVTGPMVSLSGTDYAGQSVSRTTAADENGLFAFAQLKPGTYTLVETDLPGFMSTTANAGSAGDTVVDANTIAEISLGAGTGAADYRFGDVTPPPEVMVSKELITPEDGEAAPGEEVVFRVTIANTGSTTLTQIPLQDEFEAGLSYLSATLSPDSVEGGRLLWNDLTAALGRDLAPGEQVNIDIRFQATGAIPPDDPPDRESSKMVTPERTEPECTLKIRLHLTCEGWSVEFKRTVKDPIPWRVKVDGQVIAEGTTRGEETVSGTWPAWVDLSEPHTFRAEVKEGSRWYGKSTETPICEVDHRVHNEAIVSGAVDEWGMIAPEASDEAWVAISAPPAPPVSCEALSLHSLRFDPDEPNRILATISNAGPVPARLDRVTFHWPNHPGYPQMKLDWFKLNKRTIWDGDSRRHPTEVALKGPERRRMVAPREEAVWKVKISQGPERIDQVFPIEWFGVDMAVSLGDMQCELQLPPTPPPPASCDGLTVSSLQFEEDHPDRLQATIYNGTGLPALLNRIVFQWPKSQDYPKMRLDWFKLKDKKIWNGDSKDHPADVILSSAPSKRVLFPGEQAEWEVRIKKGPKPLAEVFSPDQFAVTMYMDVAGTQCAVASKPAAPPPPAPTPTPSPTPVLEGPPVDGNPNDMSGADQICLYQADAPTNPLARIQYMQVVASDGTPQLHVALILDKSFVDNTYGANSLGYYDKRGRPKQHRFRDLVGSDHAQIYFEDANGQRVLEIKIDYISPSDAFPSGYGSLGVRGGDGSVILGDPNWILATGTALSYNFNELGYVLTQDSPATDANYTPNPDYPDWIYDVVYEMRIDMAAFGQAGLGNIGIDHVHASPSKVGVNSLPVVPGPCVP